MSCDAERKKVQSLQNQIARLEAEVRKAVGAERGALLQQIAELQDKLETAQTDLTKCETKGDAPDVVSVLRGTANIVTPLGRGHASISMEVLVQGPIHARTTILASPVALHVDTSNGSLDLTVSMDGKGIFDGASGAMSLPVSVDGNGHYYGQNPALNASVMLTTGAANSPDGKYRAQGSPQQNGAITLVAAGTLQAEIVGTTDYQLTIGGALSPPAS